MPAPLEDRLFSPKPSCPSVAGSSPGSPKTVRASWWAAGEDVLCSCPGRGSRHLQGARVIGVPAMPLPLYPSSNCRCHGRRLPSPGGRFAPDLVHVVNPAVLGWAASSGPSRARSLWWPSYHTHLPKYLEHYGVGLAGPALGTASKRPQPGPSSTFCTFHGVVEELSQRAIQHTPSCSGALDTELFGGSCAIPALRPHPNGQPRRQ